MICQISCFRAGFRIRKCITHWRKVQVLIRAVTACMGKGQIRIIPLKILVKERHLSLRYRALFHLDILDIPDARCVFYFKIQFFVTCKLAKIQLCRFRLHAIAAVAVQLLGAYRHGIYQCVTHIDVQRTGLTDKLCSDLNPLSGRILIVKSCRSAGLSIGRVHTDIHIVSKQAHQLHLTVLAVSQKDVKSVCFVYCLIRSLINPRLYRNIVAGKIKGFRHPNISACRFPLYFYDVGGRLFC